MEILLLVGCLLSGLMIARGLVMKDMTGEEAEASEPGNHRLTAVWMLVVVVCGVLVLAGCGSFWEDQGTASRTSAEARLRQAEAARENARAAIIDAEARGSLADSQAYALRSSIDSLVDLADDGEYVWLFAGLAFAIIAFAGWAIWATHRRPAVVESQQLPEVRRLQGITIETAAGPVRLVQEPQETPEQFTLRVALLAAAMATQERTLLEAPPRR